MPLYPTTSGSYAAAIFMSLYQLRHPRLRHSSIENMFYEIQLDGSLIPRVPNYHNNPYDDCYWCNVSGGCRSTCHCPNCEGDFETSMDYFLRGDLWTYYMPPLDDSGMSNLRAFILYQY